MSIFKRGKIYWYKFMWNGEMIRESTKQGSDRKARNIESAHRTRLSKQEDGRKDASLRLKCADVLLCDECEKWFCSEEARRQASHVFCSDSCGAGWTKRHTRVSTLAEFVKLDFLPYVQAHCSAKPKTAEYYTYGASRLIEAGLGELRLDEITSQHAAGFIAKQSRFSASTVNCGLRTLRRALNLADRWGKIERAPKLELAKGERQRDRIVTEPEFLAYRELCSQPWRDVVTILYGTGMRPGEAYKLRWEHIVLKGHGGLIQIVEGKTKAARRFLPILPEVYRDLFERREAQLRLRLSKDPLHTGPLEGWVFAAGSASGHLEETGAKHYHSKALTKIGAACVTYELWKKEGSKGNWKEVVLAATKLEASYITQHAEVIAAGLKPFAPYCLRHSALTRLAENGCDAFTLARIAGHSSITITQRYCHPQADAIERAFGKLAGVQLPTLPAVRDKGSKTLGGHKFRHKEKKPK